MIGDSWGYSWLPADHFSSKGVTDNLVMFKNVGKHSQFSVLEHVLTLLKHNVTNKCQPGSANSHAIGEFEKSSYLKYDMVIWFKTDPVRDLYNYHKHGLKENAKPVNEKFKNFTKTEFLSWIKRQSLNTYNAINEISHTHHNSIPVLFLGGGGRIYTDMFEKIGSKKYPSICHLGTDSIMEYLCKKEPNGINVKQGYSTLASWTPYLEYEKCKPSLVDFLYEEDKQQKLNFNNDVYKSWFAPDPYHPNPGAVYVIADLIEQFIENYFN